MSSDIVACATTVLRSQDRQTMLLAPLCASLHTECGKERCREAMGPAGKWFASYPCFRVDYSQNGGPTVTLNKPSRRLVAEAQAAAAVVAAAAAAEAHKRHHCLCDLFGLSPWVVHRCCDGDRNAQVKRDARSGDRVLHQLVSEKAAAKRGKSRWARYEANAMLSWFLRQGTDLLLVETNSGQVVKLRAHKDHSFGTMFEAMLHCASEDKRHSAVTAYMKWIDDRWYAAMDKRPMQVCSADRASNDEAEAQVEVWVSGEAGDELSEEQLRWILSTMHRNFERLGDFQEHNELLRAMCLSSDLTQRNFKAYEQAQEAEWREHDRGVKAKEEEEHTRHLHELRARDPTGKGLRKERALEERKQLARQKQAGSSAAASASASAAPAATVAAAAALPQGRSGDAAETANLSLAQSEDSAASAAASSAEALPICLPSAGGLVVLNKPSGDVLTGIRLRGNSGPPTIMALAPGSIGEATGLCVGDKLLAVNGEVIDGHAMGTQILRDAVGEVRVRRLARQGEAGTGNTS